MRWPKVCQLFFVWRRESMFLFGWYFPYCSINCEKPLASILCSPWIIMSCWARRGFFVVHEYSLRRRWFDTSKTANSRYRGIIPRLTEQSGNRKRILDGIFSRQQPLWNRLSSLNHSFYMISQGFLELFLKNFDILIGAENSANSLESPSAAIVLVCPWNFDFNCSHL